MDSVIERLRHTIKTYESHSCTGSLPADPLVLFLQFIDRVPRVDTLVFVSGVWLGWVGVWVYGVGWGGVAIRMPSCGVYRSSLSTRPPGCSGLESGKKAAFTSRPRSVSAA